jgi:hypothetical protein
MNPALMAAMNFALNSNKEAEQSDKEEIKSLVTKITNWYSQATPEEIQDGFNSGFDIPGPINNALYKLNKEYNIQFNLNNGEWTNYIKEYSRMQELAGIKTNEGI